MNLHLHREAFRELVELSADFFGYEQSHVEKDYWVSKILRELAFSEFSNRIYFKGGTSLSKAYRLISRFSEDLDLFVYSGNVSSSRQAEKTLTRNISHFIIENNEEMYAEALSKTGGDFRKLAFSYETHYEHAGLKENLEVELKCCTMEDKTTMYYPVQKRNIQPVIAEYLQATGRDDIISHFELHDFEVLTIDPKRTLCDKISKLTKLSYYDDYEILIAKHIRDVYDIYRLLCVSEYRDFIQSVEFTEAMRRVTKEDGLIRNLQSNKSVSEARFFADTENVLKLPAVFRAYHNEFKKLIFEANTLPTSDEIIQNICLLQQPLCRFEKIHKDSLIL